jgi:hypothetical protein
MERNEMSDIKMSDVFNQLAIVGGREIDSWELQDINGGMYALFYNHQACISSAKAINAYDANQERIKALEAIAFKLQEFIVETYNQYNTDRNLGIKISLRGGALITESEAILEKTK